MKRCLFIATFFLVGCSLTERPEPLPPADVLQKSAQASQALASATFSATVDFDVERPTFSVIGTAAISGRLQSAGQDVQASLEVHAGGKVAGNDFSVEATIDTVVMGEDALYFKASTLTIEPDDALFPAGTVASLQGTWWQLPLRQPGQNAVSVTPDPQLLRAQVEVVDVVEDHGFTTIDDHDVYHYTVAINRDRLLAFLEKRAAGEGESFDRSEAVAMLERLTVTGELWIDAETYHVRRVDWEVRQKATEEDAGTATVSFTMQLTDHNEAEAITAPQGAEPFSPFAFVGVPEGSLPLQGLPLPAAETPDAAPSLPELRAMDPAEQEALLRELLENGSIPFPTE